MKKYKLYFFLFLLLPLNCLGQSDQQIKPPLEAGYWKSQAINEIIIPWTKNAFHTQDATFPAYMDKEWQPVRDNTRYPGMISRHIFSYSTAYLLTGDEKYLEIASRIAHYLIQNGWDKENKLWFNELDIEGNTADRDKDMFMQLYAVTGLSMYYVVTRDEKILNYIEESIELLSEHAWDHQNDGYFNSLNHDLSVKDSTKKATPQLAPLSGYLAYLYPTTKNETYLRDTKKAIDIISNKMIDPEGVWLLESFDNQWQVNEEQSSKINVGHNQELIWMYLRLYLLTQDDVYKERALQFYPLLYNTAFNTKTGAWHHRFSRNNSDIKSDTTPWWIQAYGNMLELYMYRITGEQKHLNRFKLGADFWNSNFIDNEQGGAYLKVGMDGDIADTNKAVRSKTSYHSMEHGLLNYLYLNLWVQDKPATLHFKVTSSEQGDKFHPNIIEDPAIKIKSVKINGQNWDKFNAKGAFITLPELTNGSIEVELFSNS